MIRKLLILLCLLQFTVYGFEQKDSDARIRQLRIPLPLTETTVGTAAMLWSTQTGIPTGVEGRSLSGKPTTPGRVSSFLDLRGLRYSESVEEMMKHASGYQAKYDGSFLILRQKRTNSDLDVVVDRFTLTNASLVKAAESVWKVFEPSYVLPAHPAMPVADETEYARQRREQYNERFDPMINVDLGQVTVESILTEIAKKYGRGCSWSVRYTSDDGRFSQCILTFYAPKGAQVSAGPRR